tara:strand:+ start:2429 stop:2728 length:300 start_codon:yes stop_codon:yes gene_type:complete
VKVVGNASNPTTKPYPRKENNMTTQKQMYGVTEAQVLRDYREAERIYGEYMNLYIMAILSDAQHMIEYRKLKTANQFINKAKLLLSNRAREYLDRAKGE